LDYALDESYTPQKISIKAGNNALDLENVGVLDMNEPKGWIDLDLWIDDAQ
jgi:anaphase-promoting complex subunit 10